MKSSEAIQYKAATAALKPLLAFIRKNPGPRVVRLARLVDFLSHGTFPEKTMSAFKAGALDTDNTWNKFATKILSETDPKALEGLIASLGLGILHGTKQVRENREKYKCNIPFQILFDPTSACNMNCKGCWSAEYNHHQRLTYAQMDSIVNQGYRLGTRVYMLTGGEPLVCKKDVLKLAEAHPESTFLVYTNATLIDQALVDATKALGNVIFAISLEGFAESNDARRGAGSFDTSIAAMKLLRQAGCFFGISVCYTAENLSTVTSDAFVDQMIALGARFAFYFHYMPVGCNASPELMPSVEQREEMYAWLRKTRGSKGGKPIFVMDFQNDGEYVGGCIGGGRNYFHINSAGDMEPCVFIHYSDSNIKDYTLLEALRRPLFQAYYKGQPFNRNHLRPCPMLENPELLQKIVGATGAQSTDLGAPEAVEDLCAKCKAYAQEWKPVSARIWKDNPHPNPKTQYYTEAE